MSSASLMASVEGEQGLRAHGDGVVSGELFYFLKQIQDRKGTELKVSANLKTFLTQREGDKSHLLELRTKIIKSFLSRIRFLEHGVLEVAKKRSDLCKLRIMQARKQFERVMTANIGQFDQCVLQAVLQYASVLQSEMLEAQQALNQEREMKESMHEQARISRDIQLFAAHLRLETTGQVDLSQLSANSAQFIRCVKAVHDNLHNCFGFNADSPMLPTPDNVRILNVFKLKNSITSRNLQSSARRAAGAKMKGLFCSLPVEHVYRFCVYGLREQALPMVMQADEGSKAMQDLFRTPWIFCSTDKPLAPLPSPLQNLLKQAGHARKALRTQPPMSERPVLRFSKFSTMSTLLSFSESQLREGVCLFLCRVLMQRVKTIAQFVEDKDIVVAVQQGYDALYSSLSEEYVLLQPSYVLPEFLIRADFASLKKDSMRSAFAQSQRQSSGDTNRLPLSLRMSLRAGGGVKAGDVQRSLGIGRVQMPRWSVRPSGWNSAVPQTAWQVLLDNTARARLPESAEEEESASSPMFVGGRDGKHRENVLLKQGALLAIEDGVEEFRQSLGGARAQMARRLIMMLPSASSTDGESSSAVESSGSAHNAALSLMGASASAASLANANMQLGSPTG